MKCQIPEISWHNRDPVLSVDIQPRGESGSSSNKNANNKKWRLASGGTDAHVLVCIYFVCIGSLLGVSQMETF